MESKEYHETCNVCGDNIPSGLLLTNICVNCLVKPKNNDNHGK